MLTQGLDREVVGLLTWDGDTWVDEFKRECLKPSRHGETPISLSPEVLVPRHCAGFMRGEPSRDACSL
jgi:hypothetical protein